MGLPAAERVPTELRHTDYWPTDAVELIGHLVVPGGQAWSVGSGPCMARYVAQLLFPQLTVSHAQLLVEQLAAALAAEPQWLDCRNASFVLVLPPQGLSVQVLLEFRQQGAITVLVNSREGMGHGAPQTRHCLEQLLLLLKQQAA